MNAKQAFEGMGENFMTPKVIRYVSIPGGAVEFAVGEGFSGEPMYGVSVVNTEGDEPTRTAQSECFQSRWKAEKYIEDLERIGAD